MEIIDTNSIKNDTIISDQGGAIEEDYLPSDSYVWICFNKDHIEDALTLNLSNPWAHEKAKKTQLSESEKKRYAEAEATMAKGWEAFCNVASALNDVNGCNLYREEYDSFADYCRDKLNMKYSG